jgi:hypothetical protein
MAEQHCPVIPVNDRRIVPHERIDPPANHDDWTKAFFSSDFGWATPLCPQIS